MSKELIDRLRKFLGGELGNDAANAIDLLSNERDALAAELKSLREQEPVAVYKGHRHIPSDTKEFWGMADNHLPAGTHLYAHPIPACELTTSAICELWSEADNINDFGYAIERYLNGEGK